MERQREQQSSGGSDNPAGEDVRVNVPRAEESDVVGKYGEKAGALADLARSGISGQ